jgi:hypothetical protein
MVINKKLAEDAKFVQAGACNPTGVLHSIINHVKIEANHCGWLDELYENAAMRLLVHQLAFLMRIDRDTPEEVTSYDTSLKDQVIDFFSLLVLLNRTLESMQAARETGGGTDAIRDDESSQVGVRVLAHLFNTYELDNALLAYRDATEAVEEATKGGEVDERA